MHDNNIKSIIFRHNLLNAVRSATRKVFNVAALTVKVRKQNNLFLIELAQLFGHNHIIMRIGIFQLYNVMIPPKIVGYLPILKLSLNIRKLFLFYILIFWNSKKYYS